MNLFNVFELVVVVQLLTNHHTTCVGLKAVGGPGHQVLPDELYAHIVENVRKAHQLCASVGFKDSYIKIGLSLVHFELTKMDTSSTETELRNILEEIRLDLDARKFLTVRIDRADYLDQPNLFGEKVALAFPSAIRDIREAGNCLAAECGSGAVFHLMRAAEVALRVLAADRGVQYPDASLQSKQVGDLLGALDGKLLELRKADAKLWLSRETKDKQIAFYHTAIAEFRDFNEAWRKHMAHAHDGAFYDRDQALSILNHVRQCMQELASKISEASTTPLYWTTT